MLHVAPGTLRPILEYLPTVWLRDAHRASSVESLGKNAGRADNVSDADMKLRFSLRLLFKIIPALLTVLETLSANEDCPEIVSKTGKVLEIGF